MAKDPEHIPSVNDDSLFYTPLDRSSKEIRLLTLEPADRDDAEIVGVITVCSLKDTPPPKYEAVSYCWGDRKDTKTITIRQSSQHHHGLGALSQNFTVTANLSNALRRLRLDNEPRRLWIDAICINQNDALERSHQVSFMQSVYRSAERTLIWLGEDDGTVETALTLAVRIVRKMTHLDQLTQPDVSDDEQSAVAQEISDSLRNMNSPSILVSQAPDLPKSEDHAWKALARFLSRPWFTRVWVIQEVAMSQQATIYVGEHELDWAAIGLTAAWLSRNNILSQTGEEGFRYADNVSLMFRFASPEAIGRLDDNPLALLWLVKDYDATDARDKVFATLGLMFNEHVGREIPQLLSPDYTKTTEQAYEDVVKYCIRKDHNLDILCLVQPHRAAAKAPERPLVGVTAHHHYEHLPRPKDFASWIPRWEYGFGGGNSGPLGLFVQPTEGRKALYQACGSLAIQPITLQHQADPRSLLVRGLKLDRITSISEHIWADSIDLDLSPHPIVGQPARSNSNALSKTWEKHRNQLLAYPTSEDAMTVLRLLMVANRTRIKARADEDPNHEADFLAYIRAIGLDESIHKDLQKGSLSFTNAAQGDARRYSRDLVHSCSARSAYATSRGYLGLCHFNVQVGDIVVMLFGGKVLYVLRPRARNCDEKQTWAFLGEAYLHGAMDGQAIGGMKRAYKETSEIFDLR